jgi:hypothetical protein
VKNIGTGILLSFFSFYREGKLVKFSIRQAKSTLDLVQRTLSKRDTPYTAEIILLGANTGHHTEKVQTAAAQLEWILKDKLASQAPFDAVALEYNRLNIADEMEWNVTRMYQRDERHIELHGTQSGVKCDEKEKWFPGMCCAAVSHLCQKVRWKG